MATKPSWMVCAEKEIGVKEAPGRANNPTVVQYYEDAGHPEIHADEVPWCAAFVGAMLKRGNIKGSDSLMALSYERWGTALKGPVYGCIATKRRKGFPGAGHVMFVVGANKTHIFGLSGNAKDRVGVDAYKRSEITAYRWPANVPVPKDLPPLVTSVAGAEAATKES